jgi:serine/threonine protein phosphatase PrpC
MPLSTIFQLQQNTVKLPPEKTTDLSQVTDKLYHIMLYSSPVALIRDKQIIVANAGDSRCILSRGGKAVELSFDHKPEDDIEGW